LQVIPVVRQVRASARSLAEGKRLAAVCLAAGDDFNVVALLAAGAARSASRRQTPGWDCRHRMTTLDALIEEA
jgi:hypothetical protein